MAYTQLPGINNLAKKLGSLPAAAPAPQSPMPEAYLGDGLSVYFDGRGIVMRMPIGCYVMSRDTLHAFEVFVTRILEKKGANPAEVNVEHEGKTYRAVLLRPLTLDEIYQGLK